MSPSQIERIKTIFAEAMEKSGPERQAYLDAACGPDAPLRLEVDAFLSAAGRAGDFLISPTVREMAQTVDMPPRLREGPGSIIGRYKLLQQIGEGGFGVVFMAEQTEPVRRKVALKVIKLGMDTRQVVARFEAERQALAMMDHPNIARVLDAGATETGRPFFVMELVKGVPITDYCNGCKLTTRQRLELFMPVCSAVQHAHLKGIIHRDLKPSNVLVTLHDDKPVPKIIDFGIAKATQSSLTDKTLFTEFRQMIGTPAYMSPEQAQMSGLDIDTRTDIYSLGVLLYELLAGITPFDPKQLMAAAYAEIQRIILEVEPPRPSTRLSALPSETQAAVALQRRSEPGRLSHLLKGDLDCIILKCLEKDRARRYETANGLAQDIERHLTNEPVLARPAGLFYRFRKWVRRNKLGLSAASAVTVTLFVAVLLSVGTALAAALAVVITLFLGVVVSTSQAVRASRARSAEARQRLEAEKAREQAESARVNETRLRQQAQRRFDEIRKLTRVLMFDLHSKVARLAGSTPAIQLMFHTAQEFLEALGADAANDETLQRDMAQAHEKVGEIQGNPSRLTELGDSRGALASYNKALAIRRKFAEADPSNKADQRALAICMTQIGIIMIQMFDTAGARENFRKAQGILEQLKSESSGDQRLQLDLAELLRFAGIERSLSGDLNGALESFHRCAGMLVRLMVLTPELSSDYVAILTQLASVELNRADVFVDSGRTAEGLEHYRKCLSMYRTAGVTDPSDAEARRGEAMAQVRMGEALRTLGDPQAAAECFRQALEILKEQAAVDPANAKAQLLLAWCSEDLAGAFGKIGDWTAALQNLYEAHRIFARLAIQDPGSMNKLMSAGGTHYRIGDALAATGDTPGALDRYLQCQQIAEKLTAAFPDNPLFHRHLAATQSSIARMLGILGKGQEALEHLAKALPLAQKALIADASNILFQSTLAMIHEDTGDVLAATQDTKGACENFQSCLAIRSKINEADADNAEAREELLTVLQKLGKLSMRMAIAKRESSAESLPLWRQAREFLTRAQQEHATLVADRQPTPAESQTRAQLQSDLDACSAAIARLEAAETPP